MEKELSRAKAILDAQSCTCVLITDEGVLTSDRRGVAPLLEWLESGLEPGFYAADKVVGRATAYLYCLLGAKGVYAGIISDAAVGVFTRYGITAHWGIQVPYIRNRAGDGMCPMEAATAKAKTPIQALCAIREKLKELQG